MDLYVAQELARSVVQFAAMFWFRSLSHAVYAHVLYDLVVAAS